MPNLDTQAHCPVCDGHFRRFLPYGKSIPLSPLRSYALCPSCRCMERHRLLWLYLQTQTNIFVDKASVLHVGPELQIQKRLQSFTNLTYLSIDIDCPWAMMKLDVSDLPFAADSFHSILCIHVLQAVVDDRKALSELFRVLKPNGWAILQVPIDVDQPKTVDTAPVGRQPVNTSQLSHARLYGQDYLELLQQARFDVHVDDFVRRLPQTLITRYGLNPSEDIYICHKR